MMALKSVVLIIVGFVLLIKGADFFVGGASGIAEKFKIPQMIIGLTIVAFGTSAPEAAISISAALQGTTGIAIGNVLGSNLLNVFLILGITACIVPLHIQKSSLTFDMPFNVVISLVLLAMGFFLGKLNLVCGIILWIFMIFFMVKLLKDAKKGMAEAAEEEPAQTKNIFLLILFTIGGLAAVVFGSNITVENAKVIALSALMTTTMTRMREVVALLKERNLAIKVMIGGAVTTQEYASEIGADGYSKDAADAVKLAKRLLQ